MSLEIVYEDEYILCVNKPTNMLVHHGFHARNVADEKSLLQNIDTEKNIKTFPIHRLDRKTSGIIVLAKDKKFVSKFQELFTNQTIEKTYYGIVRGFAPETKTIDSPVKGRDAKIHKEALTYFETLATKIVEIPVKPYDSSRYSLVKMLPKTGRMHQLRVHCTKINHPLIGDPKYGDKNHNIMFEQHFDCKNLFLHAGNLQFTHPFSNVALSLNALFPIDWIKIFTKFSWENPLKIK